MLHIIFIIVRAVLILIAIIAGLAILALTAILAAPVRYRIQAACYDNIRGTVKVTWLLHILSFHLSFGEDLSWSFRIFGFLAEGTNKRHRIKKGMGRRKKSDRDRVEAMEASDVPEYADEAEEEIQVSIQQVQEKKKVERETKKKPSLFQRIKLRVLQIGKRIKRTVLTLHRIWKRTGYQASQAWGWFQEQDNIRSVRHVKKIAGRLLRHIRPRKISGKIIFGFDDPYYTGTVLSWASLLYPVYCKSLKLCPVFEQQILQGQCLIVGRIRVGTIGFHLLRTYRDQNVKRYIKRWLR